MRDSDGVGRSMSDATARAARKHRLRRGAFAALLVATLTGSQALAAPASDVHDVVTFEHAPFPYDDGFVPEQNVPFFQHDPDGRLFHLSPRGGKLYRAPTYSSPKSLLFMPATFDPSREGAAIVLFFHGNLATLATVESQQRVLRQLAASHINAALVAPQMAVRALDSSAGHFYEPGFFDLYMNEAETHLAERSGGRFDAAALHRLPVVIVAFSGGYLPTAFTLHYAAEQGHDRIAGVILLDALFGETQKFEQWILREHERTFFVSAYSKASAPLNDQLASALRSQSVAVRDALTRPVTAGDVVFLAVPNATHEAFVTRAWTVDPLADVLARVHLADTAAPAR